MRFVIPLILSVALGACTQSTVVRGKGPLVSSSGQLAEDVGIETLGGVFTPLLDRGCKVPCSTTRTFSTAEDNQTEIKIFVLRGTSQLAKDATPVGRFAVVGVPKQARGTPVIAVTFTAGNNEVNLAATDGRTKHPLVVEQREF